MCFAVLSICLAHRVWWAGICDSEWRFGRYWTNACQSCAIKGQCTTGKERRITRWEHEHILEAVQRRLDEHPEKMRQRRELERSPPRMPRKTAFSETLARGAGRARMEPPETN